MTGFLATGMALVALTLGARGARAFGHHQQECAPTPGPFGPPLAVTWVEKTVIDYKTEWQERKVETTEEQVVYKEKARVEKRIVPQLAWSDTEEMRTILTLVPRPTIQNVTKYRMVPHAPAPAPCEADCHGGSCPAGSCRPSFTPVQVPDQIPATAYDAVPVRRKFVITTPYLKDVELNYEVREAVPEVQKVKVVRVERVPMTVPVTRTIRVPVYVPQCQVPPPAPAPTPEPERRTPERLPDTRERPR